LKQKILCFGEAAERYPLAAPLARVVNETTDGTRHASRLAPSSLPRQRGRLHGGFGSIIRNACASAAVFIMEKNTKERPLHALLYEYFVSI
jgi:hypothetical protein